MVGCQWGRKVVTHDSKSDLPLATYVRMLPPNITNDSYHLEYVPTVCLSRYMCKVHAPIARSAYFSIQSSSLITL